VCKTNLKPLLNIKNIKFEIFDLDVNEFSTLMINRFKVNTIFYGRSRKKESFSLIRLKKGSVEILNAIVKVKKMN
jgi:hypothetical protein